MTYQKDNQFQMAGTERSGEYVVVLVSSLGRVGYREFEEHCECGECEPEQGVRIRVEPASEETAGYMAVLFPRESWKQYGEDGQPRFSTVVENLEAAEGPLALAFEALRHGQAVELNPELVMSPPQGLTLPSL